MFESFGKFALRSNAVDAAIGVIAGGVLGLIVSSMVGDLIMVAVLFVVIQAFNKIGRMTRQRRSVRSSLRSPLLQSRLAECGQTQRRQLRQLPPMTG